MEQPVPRPETIDALRWGADAAFALLAGMQLDLFTALQRGPQTPPQLAATLGVGAGRLRLLLYALVAAGLLTDQDGCVANTPEAQHFLVQGTPTSLGPLHHNLAAQWAFKLHTAASIRTGVPQAHLDFAQASPDAQAGLYCLVGRCNDLRTGRGGRVPILPRGLRQFFRLHFCRWPADVWA